MGDMHKNSHSVGPSRGWRSHKSLSLWAIAGSIATIVTLLVTAWQEFKPAPKINGRSGAIVTHSPPGSNASPSDCEQDPRKPLALAIGARANSPAPRLPQKVVELLRKTAEEQQPITLIRLDGSPRVVFAGTFSSGAYTRVHKSRALAGYLQHINRVLWKDIPARVPEADDLTALTLAAEAAGHGGNVVLIDSGLATTGGLDFLHRSDFLSSDPSKSVNYLTKNRLLPDLRTRNILFAGLGYTAAPQPQLNYRIQKNTRAIWNKLARAGGALCVSEDKYPNTQHSVTGVPPVSVISHITDSATE
jgi:hypothetical protein